MLSFGLPPAQIKNVLNKYLKHSKIIPLQMAKEITMGLQEAQK